MMNLQASTGSAEADKIIADVVSSFAAAMAGRVRGFYVAGSYAEGKPVPGSDIDLIVVLREKSDEELARGVSEACVARSPVRLDLVALTAEALAERFIPLVPAFKMGTLLVAGEDVRDELSLPPLAAYAAAWADRARRFMSRIRRVEVETIRPSLGYPDPRGEFFGYDRATIAEWYPPSTTRSTKELVAIVGSAATSLIALRGGAYVPTKGRCAPLYAEHIGDEWTGLVSKVHAFCRERLGYGVPEILHERIELRAICAKVLGFERHALAASEAPRG
jgi:predicted nucleotidyltransferase